MVRDGPLSDSVVPIEAKDPHLAGAAGVWRARGRGVNTQQSSLMLLLLVVVAAVLVWFVMGR